MPDETLSIFVTRLAHHDVVRGPFLRHTLVTITPKSERNILYNALSRLVSLHLLKENALVTHVLSCVVEISPMSTNPSPKRLAFQMLDKRKSQPFLLGEEHVVARLKR